MSFSTLLATGYNFIIYNDITFKGRTQLELFLQAFPGKEFMFVWILNPNISSSHSRMTQPHVMWVSYFFHDADCNQSAPSTWPISLLSPYLLHQSFYS